MGSRSLSLCLTLTPTPTRFVSLLSPPHDAPAQTTFKGKVYMTHPTKAIFRWTLDDYIRVSNFGPETQLCVAPLPFHLLLLLHFFLLLISARHDGVRLPFTAPTRVASY